MSEDLKDESKGLHKECAALRDLADGYVRRASEGFSFPCPFLELMWRSAIRKDHDIFGTVLDLIGQGKSGLVLPLLRPMCEDLIFISYFLKIDPTAAERILRFGSMREVFQSMKAQSDDDTSSKPPFFHRKTQVAKDLKKIDAELIKMGKPLGWGDRAWPTVAFVARQVDMEIIYEKIYHGTSRGVHFSMHHLLRMVWGKPGQDGSFSTNLDNFERYYEAYAMTNAAWLYCALLSTVFSGPGEDPGDELDQGVRLIIERLQDLGNIPIVTLEEMTWPTDPGKNPK